MAIGAEGFGSDDIVFSVAMADVEVMLVFLLCR